MELRCDDGGQLRKESLADKKTKKSSKGAAWISHILIRFVSFVYFVLAAAALERSLALHPNYKLSLYLYGKILFERGRYEDAAARLERAVIVDPNYLETARYLSLAHQRLAVTRRAEGLHEEAVDHWQRALEMVPGEVNLINGLAVEYHHAGRVDAAIVLLEQAAVAHPNDGRMMGNLGSFYALALMAVGLKTIIQ